MPNIVKTGRDEVMEECWCPRCECTHMKKLYWTGRRDIPIKKFCAPCKEQGGKDGTAEHIRVTYGRGPHIEP